MLEVQHTPLLSEADYFIDVMLDEQTIDSATGAAVRLYGERGRINEIVLKPEGEDEQPWRRRKEAGIDLMGYASELIAQMSPPKQGALASVALTHLDYMSRETSKFMAFWAVGDMAEGGYGKAYNRPPRCQRGTVLPFKKDWRRLHSPNWIRRYVKREAEAWRIRRVAAHVLPRLQGLDPELIRGGLDFFQEDKILSDVRRREYEAAQWDRINAQIEAGVPANEAIRQPDCIVRLKPGIRKKLRRERLEYRKVARRGIATANAIVGPEKTAAFVRGEPVILEGVNMNFAVQRNGRVAGAGHGQISLGALATDGTPLADLCFYVEDTPAIDQLTALALHAAAGEEQDIISAANLIRASHGALGHPAFELKRAEHAALLAERAAQRVLVVEEDGTPLYVEGPNWQHFMPDPRSIAFRDLADQRNEDYWRETQHMWIESFQIFMVGHRWRKVMLRNASEATE